jgi:Transposase domain (DUF772)
VSDSLWRAPSLLVGDEEVAGAGFIGAPDGNVTTLSTEDLIPQDHPIRRIRGVIDAVLAELDPEFSAMCATVGRPSVPPESLLKATILMARYSIHSERAVCERLNYDLVLGPRHRCQGLRRHHLHQEP